MFCKKGVLKNLAKLTRKQLCWSLFCNKVAGLFWLNTSCGYFCSVLLPWRLHQKRIWIAKDLRERNFLWRNKWNCESNNFKINNTVKSKIDIFSYCLRLDMKETRIFFFYIKTTLNGWIFYMCSYLLNLIAVCYAIARQYGILINLWKSDLTPWFTFYGR